MTEVTNAELADLLEEVADDLSSLRALPLRLAAARLREAPSVSDSAGWIEWGGGECPVLPFVRVEYQMRENYYPGSSDLAGELRWDHVGSPGDIVRYRLSV